MYSVSAFFTSTVRLYCLNGPSTRPKVPNETSYSLIREFVRAEVISTSSSSFTERVWVNIVIAIELNSFFRKDHTFIGNDNYSEHN